MERHEKVQVFLCVILVLIMAAAFVGSNKLLLLFSTGFPG